MGFCLPRSSDLQLSKASVANHYEIICSSISSSFLKNRYSSSSGPHSSLAAPSSRPGKRNFTITKKIPVKKNISWKKKKKHLFYCVPGGKAILLACSTLQTPRESCQAYSISSSGWRPSSDTPTPPLKSCKITRITFCLVTSCAAHWTWCSASSGQAQS